MAGAAETLAAEVREVARAGAAAVGLDRTAWRRWSLSQPWPVAAQGWAFDTALAGA